MYFDKYPHPVNFRFATRYRPAASQLRIGSEQVDLEVEDLGGNIFRLHSTDRRWAPHQSLAGCGPMQPKKVYKDVKSARDGV